MRLKVDTVLRDLNGKPIADPNLGGDMTLSGAAVGALLAANPRDNQEGVEKFKRYLLAKKIMGVTEAELTIEELATIKKLIGDAWTVIVVGPAWELLETAAAPPEGNS